MVVTSLIQADLHDSKVSLVSIARFRRDSGGETLSQIRIIKKKTRGQGGWLACLKISHL